MSGIVYRSQKGSKLTSNEVDGNFQYLEGLVGGQGNAIITETGFSLVGQDLTINAGWEWKILNQSYSNASAVVLNIPLATSGNQRIDIVVANQSGGFERVSGIESNSNPTAPAVPTNKLVVTFLNVNDGEILDPDSPILGTQFKKKSESAAYNDPTLSGSDAVIPLQPNGQGVYAFSNAGLTSIDGFGLDLITGNPSAEVPYPGKDILIYNNKAGNLTLKHDGSGTADVKFFFIDETDLIIPAGGKVWLKYGPSYCEMIFKSWIDVDLSSKADLVGGKVPASQLPAYVDDVLEFANLSAFPVTGETGIIYVALDTNFTYRWSGSAYVQIGGGGGTTKIIGLVNDAVTVLSEAQAGGISTIMHSFLIPANKISNSLIEVDYFAVKTMGTTNPNLQFDLYVSNNNNLTGGISLNPVVLNSPNTGQKIRLSFFTETNKIYKTNENVGNNNYAPVSVDFTQPVYFHFYIYNWGTISGNSTRYFRHINVKAIKSI